MKYIGERFDDLLLPLKGELNFLNLNITIGHSSVYYSLNILSKKLLKLK